ncbi:tRNA-specific adenosine deaminase [Clostridia bacterium]|nr:tRNA-specific adenosine deaminase [Clostridia bacterium]
MRAALSEADQAALEGEVPVGAVIQRNGAIIARAHNRCESLTDPTAHAELLAIQAAARVLGFQRLTDCALYVTLEPCAMCAGAIRLARLKFVYFGAADPSLGCCGSVYRLTEDPALGGFIPASGGLLEDECATRLSRFLLNINKEQ